MIAIVSEITATTAAMAAITHGSMLERFIGRATEAGRTTVGVSSSCPQFTQ